ncbi:MAG: amidohydrolase family protein [Clostridia bacterium]|nr:amidohydrolase family protein [Clostridia bacterium]
MGKILIKNGKVWDGERFYFADILTDNEKISKIADDIDEYADFVYDATDKIVSPGLVDIHVHMKGIALEEFGIEPHMSSFPFGVTAVNDAGSSLGNRLLLDSFSVKNTVFVCVGIRNNHADFTATEELCRKYGDKAIGIKVYFDTTITDCSDITPLREISNYAKKHKLKVMVHCSNSPTSMVEIVEALSTGDILTHIYHGGKNSCTENNFEAFMLAREKGVMLDAGFAGYVHTDFLNFQNSINAGFLPDTISTDVTRYSAYKRGGRYGLTMCMNIAKHLGVDVEDIFRSVTSNPAKALGKENEWGHLKVGRCADIAVFDYKDEAFELTDNAGHQIIGNKGYRCVLTVVDGEIIYKD